MKLGFATANVFNHLMAKAKMPAPKVGDGATVLMWSDRHAVTIVGVSKSGRKVKTQRDRPHRTDKDGMSDSQSYTYDRDPQGKVQEFSLRKNGEWIEVNARNGARLSIGHRSEYYDYSF